MNSLDTTTLILVGLGIIVLVVLAAVFYVRRARPQPEPPLLTVKLLPESYLIYNGDLLVDAAAVVEAHNLCAHPIQLCAFQLKVGKHVLHLIETRGRALPYGVSPNETERFKFRKRDFCDVPDPTYIDTTAVSGFFVGADAEIYPSGKQNIKVYKE